MSGFGVASWVRSRKRRSCDSCRREIPLGAMREYHRGVYEGEFFSTNVCRTCSMVTRFVERSWRGINHDYPWEWVNEASLYDLPCGRVDRDRLSKEELRTLDLWADNQPAPWRLGR